MVDDAKDSDTANVSAGSVESPTQDAKGRFLPGNRLGANKLSQQRVTRYRHAFYSAVDDDELRALARQMYQIAMAGDVAAARFVAEYTIGKPMQQEMEIDASSTPGQLVINLVTPETKN